MFAGLELTPTATRWDSATSPTEGPRSANREAEAVMGLQSPAVGTEAGAKADTALFQQAKEELGPEASVSEVAREHRN